MIFNSFGFSCFRGFVSGLGTSLKSKSAVGSIAYGTFFCFWIVTKKEETLHRASLHLFFLQNISSERQRAQHQP